MTETTETNESLLSQSGSNESLLAGAREALARLADVRRAIESGDAVAFALALEQARLLAAASPLDVTQDDATPATSIEPAAHDLGGESTVIEPTTEMAEPAPDADDHWADEMVDDEPAAPAWDYLPGVSSGFGGDERYAAAFEGAPSQPAPTHPAELVPDMPAPPSPAAPAAPLVLPDLGDLAKRYGMPDNAVAAPESRPLAGAASQSSGESRAIPPDIDEGHRPGALRPASDAAVWPPSTVPPSVDELLTRRRPPAGDPHDFGRWMPSGPSATLPPNDTFARLVPTRDSEDFEPPAAPGAPEVDDAFADSLIESEASPVVAGVSVYRMAVWLHAAFCPEAPSDPTPHNEDFPRAARLLEVMPREAGGTAP
jgi:hypothetical protein